MAEIQAIYQAMARMAPPELAESWDNVGLLVDCGRPATRALTALDITPEVVEEARQLGCGVIVAHHPVIFSPLKRLDCRDVAFLLVQAGISAICMHTNLDAAEGGVNEVLAEILGIRDPVPFAGGCGRVGELDAVSPLTVPELARLAQKELAARCVPPLEGPAVQVKYTDNGRPVRRLAVISGSGGSMFEEALVAGADCLLTGEANHHAACDARRLGSGTDRRRTLCHRISGCCGSGPAAGSDCAGAGGCGQPDQPGPVYIPVRNKMARRDAGLPRRWSV